MKTFARILTLVVALLLVPASAASARSLQTGAATNVTGTSATLNAQVNPGGSDDYFRFEYGIGAYQRATSWVSMPAGSTRPVSATITGLTADSTYRFRLVVADLDDWDYGADATFRTAAASTAPTTPTPVTPLPTPVAPQPEAAPAPVIGDTVVVAPAAGTVKVKAPGGGYTTLKAGDDIPVGSLVDTRAGTVALTSAVAPGVTQTGEFRGALFEVRQAANGMTDLVLRGAELSGCGRATAAARRKPPVRRLWGSDNNGKFRTHGRHSVATVRGTKWVTTETCAGTRTTVTEGAVSVRDKRLRKSVLVRAGQSYLARPR